MRLFHNLMFVTKKDFDMWVAGELLYDTYERKLVLPSDENSEYLDELQSYSDFTHGQFGKFEENYKTEHGDEIVAFGYYGLD